MHFGIDYGSKMAGTTVITYDEGNLLRQRSSLKNKDADQFILQAIQDLKPTSVFIDAPLSLPKAYFGKGHDYFYREADKKLKAMSPMFLGGLTARAMKLKSELVASGNEVFETYPGALVRSNSELSSVYDKKAKKPNAALLGQIRNLLGTFKIESSLTNMHQIDSILAWYSGLRFAESRCQIVGNKEEGIIIY